jgi:hypothetical protein
MPPTGLLYLHSQHMAIAGQRGIAGKRLLGFLRNESNSVITAHLVRNSDSLAGAHPNFSDDAIGVDELSESNIGVVYCEGGIESSLSQGGNAFGRSKKHKSRHS